MKLKKKIKIFILILVNFYLIYNLYNYINLLHEKRQVQNYFNSNIKTITKQNQNNYLGVLEIPKIKLQKGFYDINNKNNKVNKNIEVLKNSIMPNEDNSVLAIASHSGNGKKAYFKNLHKLKVGDLINLYYQDESYNYIVRDIYEEEKNGQISFNKEYGKVIVLTTCSYHKNKQLIVIAELTSQKKLQI